MGGNQIPGVGPSFYRHDDEGERAPRAYPVGPEKPQWLQGKMTFLGIIITFVGALAGRFGLTLPTDETQDFLHWLSANWDFLAEGVGILIAAYGRFRINRR